MAASEGRSEGDRGPAGGGTLADRADRLAAWAGVLSPAVALGAIAAAVLVADGFSPTADALSDLGRVGRASAPLFNYGLVAAGLLAVPFGLPLVRASRHPLGTLGVGAFGVAALSLAGVGAFPLPTAPHAAVAVGFYLSFTVAFWLYGTGEVLAGAVRRGLATVWLGIVHVLTWVGWAAWAAVGGAAPGLAIPETVGALLLVGWMVATARRFIG